MGVGVCGRSIETFTRGLIRARAPRCCDQVVLEWELEQGLAPGDIELDRDARRFTGWSRVVEYSVSVWIFAFGIDRAACRGVGAQAGSVGTSRRSERSIAGAPTTLVCLDVETPRPLEVHVVADAVSSRTALNRDIALRTMRDAGASITSVETALFELLRVAEGEKFKEILKIVK